MKETSRSFPRIFLLILALVAGTLFCSAPAVQAASVGKAGFSYLAKTGSTQVKLRWKAVKNASGYKLFYRKGKSGSFKTLATIPSGSTVVYTAKKLNKSSVYYFRVQAYKKSSGKKITGKVSETRSVDMRAPAAPVLRKASGKSKALAITWKKVSGAKGYELYRKTGSGGTYKKIKTIKNGSTIKATDKKASAGKTYYYKIRAVAGGRKGSFSEELQVRVLANKSVEVVTEEKQNDFAKAVASLVKRNKVKASSAIAAADKYYTGRLIVKRKIF